MNMYNEALAMKDTLTADRRHFHQNPELGLELPKTAPMWRKVKGNGV